jgi:DNA-binding XRE family transcriptional regulator
MKLNMKKIAFGALICVKGASRSNWIIVIIATSRNASVSAMQPFTVEQARAARAFLGWSQHELGDAAGLSFETIRNFERDQSATKKSMTAIRTAFHDAGVEFHRRGERVGVTIVVWSQPW